MTAKTKFQKQEYQQQADFFASCADAETGDEECMLMPSSKDANLHPDYRKRMTKSFDCSDAPKIGWSTQANHGASTQVCCVNFLFPFADKPELLGRWIDHVLAIDGARPEVIERRNGEDHYVAFEWFPKTDYLNEGDEDGKRSRGIFSTSLNAAVCYRLGSERRLLLIEWKYTEGSGANKRTKEDEAGDATRLSRYQNIWKRPHGPIRADADVQLEEFFLNPWYQLLRQQMTAYHAESDPQSCYDHAMLLHISPKANDDLRCAKGPLDRFGGDLFEAFSKLLNDRSRNQFVSIDTAEAFSVLSQWPEATWFGWLQNRYPALT